MSWSKALESDAVDPRHEWTTTRRPVAFESGVVPHTLPRTPRPMSAAVAFDLATSLRTYYEPHPDDPERVVPVRYAFPDAHGVRIPTGMTEGSTCDYAAACVRERPWPRVMLAMLKKEAR